MSSKPNFSVVPYNTNDTQNMRNRDNRLTLPQSCVYVLPLNSGLVLLWTHKYFVFITELNVENSRLVHMCVCVHCVCVCAFREAKGQFWSKSTSTCSQLIC